MKKRINHIKFITIVPFISILSFMLIGLLMFLLSDGLYFNSSLDKSQDLQQVNSKRIEIDLSKPHHEDIDEIVETGIFPNSVPSLSSVKFESAEDASTYLEEDSLGIGFELDGISRFYPNQILIWHSVVNDTIAETPILISYCPFCSSSVVYSRIVDGETLEFQTGTKLWKDNLLIRDTSKSPSLWSSLIGEAIYGDMFGESLELLRSKNLTFAEWKEEHPDTEVLSRDTGFQRPYELDPLSNDNIYADFQNPSIDLDPRTFLSVVIFEENAYGVSLNKVKTEGISCLENENVEVKFYMGEDQVQTLVRDKLKATETETANIIAPYFVIKALFPNAQIAL